LAQQREQVRAARSKKVGKAHNFDRSTGRGAQGYFAEQAEKAAARNKRNSDNKKEEIEDKLKSLSPVKKKKVMSHIETSDRKGSLFRMSHAILTIAGKEILKDVSFAMAKGDRIALAGNNGSGKSALVKALLDKEGFELIPKPFVNEKLRIEYLDQHYSLIDKNKSVLENVLDFAGVAPERAREHLSHFLFSETVGVSHKASTLSGGMLARLAFVMLTIAPIDLLILDEPTNNLDMETIDAIAELLLEYHGGLLVISHDVAFLEKLNLEKTYTVKDGTVTTA
jgi:ATPase subunit of ABC transporter with duplicated ATPase domains